MTFFDCSVGLSGAEVATWEQSQFAAAWIHAVTMKICKEEPEPAAAEIHSPLFLCPIHMDAGALSLAGIIKYSNYCIVYTSIFYNSQYIVPKLS